MVRNQDSYERDREHTIREKSPILTAQVTSVRSTDSTDTQQGVVCNVINRRSDRQWRQVPVDITEHEGNIYVPQVNDWVRVEFHGRRGQAPIITQVVHTQDGPPPLATPGDWRHEFRRDNADPLYVEAERVDHSAGEPNVVRMGVKPNGTSDPTTEVAVDDSGSSTEVRIETDGDITISASGDVLIDEGGSTTPVAKQGHTHDFSYNGGGKNSSSKSGTTGQPNESGTSVELE